MPASSAAGRPCGRLPTRRRCGFHEKRFASRSGDVSAQSGERVAVVVGVAAVLGNSEELGERPGGIVGETALGFAWCVPGFARSASLISGVGGGVRTRML